MKIQIDTNAKTIKVEGNVKLSDLFDQLQKFFPDGEWEDYNLETNTVIHNWGNPIVINKPYNYPWWTGDVFCGTTSSTMIVNDHFNGTITNCGATTSAAVYNGAAGTDINHPNNQNFTLTTASSGGPIYIDMRNETAPEVATSGYCQTVGIYNIELN